MAQHPIEKLIAVMAKLRDPNGGCPWDLEQDFKSIAPYTIEEAYEVADAIERGDINDLKEELGDLLLQPIYHAQMASEVGLFDINEVINGVTAKMIDRHPHVFGDVKAAKASDVDKIWDEKKKEERRKKNDEESVLDGVAKALPALLRAQKLQKKAAKVGFEWKTLPRVLDKLEEEIKELREALLSGDTEHTAEELGDLLFVLANFARMTGIDAETALRSANDKFARRFRGIENDFKVKHEDIKDASLEEMEAMWVEQTMKEKR